MATCPDQSLGQKLSLICSSSHKHCARMAEVVHRNLESMLPQLEELEASGIFSHNEIK